MEKFKNIYIIGAGKVAKECQKITQDYFNQEIIYLNDLNNLNDFFKNIKNCLIISANNFYIFKKECIQNNIIINYHNALLPYHRGCNAHIWSIWDNDKQTGITWHLVEESIDTGEILIQQKIKLNNNFTSLSLLNSQHKLAISSLKKALQNLQNSKTITQNNKKGKYHKKSEFPNKGFLNLSWNQEKIYRFLRAMDCGILSGIPKPKLKLLGKEKEILFYQINDLDLILNLSDNTILKITKD
ncbi:formyltransferase family protein [Campylobacter hepaticus]|uniref:formyltransferase family protein n=1 Tax=Campylobacter hepaticus TaxID=1813019 RepID=UPI0029A8CC27|nr:formyltransferase family protein [Campylobacter hepaticus]MDX2330792.1 formyltransferase family protein [Campylobacter hepaticus]MDX2371407.1 formyltransferase family protein [Campylobacter hepaticus]MDX2396657.1 formyltransferase family protein [Campylobacter hepaticus]MDX5508565.1 formyltransferase family protein [Campylobacter hepaticus]